MVDFICPKKQTVEQVARAFGLTGDDIRSPGRSRELVVPRQLAMLVLRKRFPEVGCKRIARLVNRRDHTTVLYGLKAIESRIERDAELRAKAEVLMVGRMPVMANAHVLAWHQEQIAQGNVRFDRPPAKRDPETGELLESEKAWCEQCQARLPLAQIDRCAQRFCSFRRAA